MNRYVFKIWEIEDSDHMALYEVVARNDDDATMIGRGMAFSNDWTAYGTMSTLFKEVQ